MTRFRRQLLIGNFLLLLVSGLAVMVHCRFNLALPNYAYLTGWVLFAAMALLAVYNARKRIPFLPLGSSESWMQIHVYAGFFTIVLFLIHLKFHMPTGWFEGTLAWLYVLVTASGIAGLILSRVLPRRLSTRGGEVIYEKIPAIRNDLRQQAEALALGTETKSQVIAEFYARQLSVFFAGPKNFWRHLLESRQPLNAVMVEVEELRRYLSDQERAVLEKLAQLVRQKDGLDYHQALQTALKLWLFMHIPLTYSLMIFTLLHMVLVYAFSGDAR
jgi:asparagine N-glycosylation enzyme membrane subunit Stt3